MRVLYQNIFTESEISATNENSYFPVTSIMDGRGSELFRTQNTYTSTVITFALSESQTANAISIVNHNFTSSASVVLSNDNGLSQTITIRDNIILFYFTSSTSQNWYLTISDPTNSDERLEIGELFLGEYLQISPSSLSDFSIEYETNDIIQESYNFSNFGSEGIYRRIFTFKFPKMSYETYLTIFKTFILAVRQVHTFIFANFDTNFDLIEPCLCTLGNNLIENYKKRMKINELEIIIKEVK